MEQFKREIEAAIEADDPEELLSVVIDVSLAGDDPVWAADRLLDLADHDNKGVRGNALIGLVHLAQRFPELNRSQMIERIRLAAEDPELHVREQAESAMEELAVG
ncbi:MAG: hypothetical protein CBC48_20665 [bacterium TMED88]|nr:hypothetical protein [Deltaproteobacteria bacterium]OUV21032.1 MAG: hypothetical protein CBC48_20665 [bacterium TMED88]